MQPDGETIGIIWDMDGVLADSNALHWAAWQATLPAYGLEMTFAQFEATCGMADADIMPLLFGAELAQRHGHEIAEDKEARYRALAQRGMEPFAGVRELLAGFAALGCPQGVASSAPMENIAATLMGLDIWHWFDTILSGARIRVSKPDPTLFLRTAASLGRPAQRCLVIEDSTAGVEAARRAGMTCLAVTNTRSAAELSLATQVVDSLAGQRAADLIRLIASVRS
jgi:HAD superfamily hydrolase (TIGR01509 family)